MEDSLALIISVAHIAAVIALFNGVLTTLGQAKIAVAAIESIARQPEAAGSVTSNMFIGLAIAETGGIYGLLISIIILFANPLIPMYLNNIA